MYTVNYWGSHPDAMNDDCWSGHDFDTLSAAEDWFTKAPVFSTGKPVVGSAYVELDGPGVHRVRKNPDYRAQADDDGEWRREIAMQAGMAFGCDGYNDAMGYSR